MNIKLLFIPLLLFSSQLYAETIHLGILNTSGNEAENFLYSETASVLNDKLKPRNVEVSTYDLPGLEKAIAAGKLDFFISNPGFYVSSREKLDTTALASQRNQFFGRPDRALGSVFVVPRLNSNVFSLRDLRGKSVCTVAPNAYGGLYIALGELNRRGFNPDSFFSSIHYTGYPMPKVLKELGGKYEVGFSTESCGSVIVQIDPTQFEIVLLNLLNNAAEAIAQQETNPKISVILAQENRDVLLSVRNQGVLEHKESFNNLFAVKSSTKTHGLGLGLAIAARVIERWGGQLSICQNNEEVVACIRLPIP